MGYGSETAALGCGACEIRSREAGERLFRADKVPEGARSGIIGVARALAGRRRRADREGEGMVNLFSTVTKYLCILFIVLYSYCNFRILSLRREENARTLCGLQFQIILLIHLLFSAVILLKTEDPMLLLFYFAQLAFFLIYRFLFRRIYRNVNQLLLNNVCLFLCYGFIMLERLNLNKSLKQYVIAVAASFLSLLIPFLIDNRLYFAGIGIFFLLLVFGIGVTSYGARMSLSIGGFSFQLSELVKISFVLSLSGFLYQARRFREILPAAVIAGAHILILVLCKDLGSALIFFLSFLVMLYIATNRSVYLFLGGIAMSLAASLSYFLFQHVRTRFFAWRDPWADMSDRGYQITQSLFAIGTGGFFGLGLFQGLPNKIPIVEKDFIISAISEEMGAVTAICLTLLCLGCFMQMMMIATYMEFSFYKLAAVGLAMQYIAQVFLTIGGAVKFIPSTGVTLPFVSYGGSSLIASFFVFSLIQALYIIQGNEDEAEEEGEERESCERGGASAFFQKAMSGKETAAGMGKSDYGKESALSDYEDFDEEGEEEDFEEEEGIGPEAEKRDLSGKEGRKKGGRNGR